MDGPRRKRCKSRQRSGALRSTDQLQMFKRVDVEYDGSFEHVFFAHGLRHLSEGASGRVLSLEKGEQLRLCLDLQNPFDDDAVLIRADAPAEIVGYCPRYISKDISDLLLSGNSDVSIYVENLSASAPTNYRLMCRLQGKVEQAMAHTLMNREEFQPISSLETTHRESASPSGARVGR